MSSANVDKLVRLIKWGFLILPFSALIVGGSFWGKILLPGVGDLFFPFITGKNLFFRVIVEILFALWIFAAVFDKRLRPKFTPVFWAILATLFILTLSTIFGANPYRSFWSNYERMEGLIGHLHLFIYFLVLTSVFLKYEDWKRFFFVSLGVSFIVSSYGYFQSLGLIKVYQSSERIDATLGNSTYLAIYIIFHLFLALYFLLSAKSAMPAGRQGSASGGKEDPKWLRYILGALIVYEIPLVFLTATRGAILGLFGGSLILALFFGIFGLHKQLKRISLGFIGLLLITLASFWFLKDTAFVQDNYVLRRFANISLSEQTTKSRFLIWSISWEGFKERPILGWGIENFDQVFNRHYKPELWSNEPWFDRSHNVVFDWLIHAGVLGFLSYFSIFTAAFYMLWKSFSRNEAIIFSTLFLVYIFHNMFVFDNLTSYFMFFSVLGFLHFKYNPSKIEYHRTSPNQAHFIIPVTVFVLIVFTLYFANFKPLRASNALIKTMRDFSTNGQNTNLILSDFEKVFSYNTFGTGEAREQMVQYTNAALASELPEQDKVKIVEKTIAELKKQIAENPDSARIHVMLANIYDSVGLFDDALKTLEKALKLSPKKQQIHFIVADVYFKKNDLEKTFEAVRTAYEFDPTFKDAAKNLAIVAILSGKEDFAEEVLMKTFGEPIIPDEQLINAYGRVGNWRKVKDIWELFIKKDDGKNQNTSDTVIQYRISLAATYLKLGERQKAIEVIREAISIKQDFQQQGEALIKEIQSGKNF